MMMSMKTEAPKAPSRMMLRARITLSLRKKKLKSDDTEASIKKFTSTTDTEVKPPEGIAERDFNRFPEKVRYILSNALIYDL